MPRYKLLIEYLGTAYSGWQKQPNALTVEDVIEDALAQVLGESVDVIGQGRTDSGVHAEGQTAHFDVADPVNAVELQYAFLGLLPGDIAVWGIEKVADDFHARFDATYRHYSYRIARRPRPLEKNTSLMVIQDLNIEAMNSCAELSKGEHNFDSFTKPDNQNPVSKCKVLLSKFSERDDMLVYHIRANRFVRHQVRRLVGTMLQVGKEKQTVEDFADLLHKPAKQKNAHGAAAKGLILKEVSYKKIEKILT